MQPPSRVLSLGTPNLLTGAVRPEDSVDTLILNCPGLS